MGNKACSSANSVPQNSDFVYKTSEGYIKPKRLDDDDVLLEGSNLFYTYPHDI